MTAAMMIRVNLADHGRERDTLIAFYPVQCKLTIYTLLGTTSIPLKGRL
jgi:hypothetical protein